MTPSNTLTSIQRRFSERDGKSKLPVLSTPLFWFVLGIKIATLLFFGSTILKESYIPFVAHFVSSPFSNPYIWAAEQGVSFPFPAAMLFILAAAKSLFSFLPPLLAIRIPLLIADLAIFLVLARWLKDRQRAVLWWYWCSPVVFAATYIAGFLDILPIALLFGFLYFLFKEQYLYAFALLGLAFATKTGLLILLPFVLIYVFKESRLDFKTVGYVSLPAAIYLLLCGAYIRTPEFIKIALSGGQFSLSDAAIHFSGAVLYIVPLVYFGLLTGALGFQRLNRDVFLMFIAFALGSITLFVLPQAAWYLWILPFFVYFFVKNDHVQNYPLVLLQLFYFAYFLLAPKSEFLEALQVTFTPASSVYGNVAFTLLQGALLLTIFWIYQLGIQRAMKHKLLYKPYLVGIAGDSASGKSTITKLLEQIFGKHNTLEIAGDDMHKWERGDPRWSEVTHLNPIANRLHDDAQHALTLKHGLSVVRRMYDHAIGRFTLPERIRPKKIVVLQGLHTLYLPGTRDLLDLKVFLAPDEDLRRKWKIERDTKERGSDPARVLEQLQAREADSEKYILEQKRHADIVISFTQQQGRPALEMFCDMHIQTDQFVHALEQKTELSVQHEHVDGAEHLVITGDVSAETIEDIAYELLPEVWEINRTAHHWEAGLNGVIQLFLAHAVFYKAKLEHAVI